MSPQQVDSPSCDIYRLSPLLSSLGEPSPKTVIFMIVLSWGGVPPRYLLCMYYFLNIFLITHFRVVLSFEPLLDHDNNHIRYKGNFDYQQITSNTTKSPQNYHSVTKYKYIHILSPIDRLCRCISRVARHVGRFKLVSKPAQLYVKLSIIPLSQLTTYVSSGNIRHWVVTFVCLHFALPDTRVLNSLADGLGIYIYTYVSSRSCW